MTHTHVHMHAGRHFYIWRRRAMRPEREREKFNLPVTRSSPSQHVRGKLVSARESSSPCRNKTRRPAMLLCELIFKPHTHSLARGARRLFQNCCSESFAGARVWVCAFFCLCAGWRLIFTSLAYQKFRPGDKRGWCLKLHRSRGSPYFFHSPGSGLNLKFHFVWFKNLSLRMSVFLLAAEKVYQRNSSKDITPRVCF